MHVVGRSWARRHQITLENMFRHVPRSNDPGCSAGFGMGMVIYLGTKLVLDPRSVVPTCTRLPTRFREYTCIHGTGHALMRGYHGQLAGAVLACTQARPEIRARLLARGISRLLDLARRRRRNDAAAKRRYIASVRLRRDETRAPVLVPLLLGTHARGTRVRPGGHHPPVQRLGGNAAGRMRGRSVSFHVSSARADRPRPYLRRPRRSRPSRLHPRCRRPCPRRPVAQAASTHPDLPRLPRGGHMGLLLLVRPHALGRHGRSLPSIRLSPPRPAPRSSLVRRRSEENARPARHVLLTSSG